MNRAALAFSSIVLMMMSVTVTSCSDDQSLAEPSSSSISRSDAIDDHWDEIKEYLDGTETIEACSSERSDCYDLEADIADGVIETVHFSNGGFLRVSADIESDGTASDSDQRGTYWDFTIDLDSALITEAIDAWAEENGYQIE